MENKYQSHKKHFTASERAAYTALGELFKAGLLPVLAHTEMMVFDKPELPDMRSFVFRYEDCTQTLIRVKKTSETPDRWEASQATVKVNEHYWILFRFDSPIRQWVPQMIDSTPNFAIG